MKKTLSIACLTLIFAFNSITYASSVNMNSPSGALNYTQTSVVTEDTFNNPIVTKIVDDTEKVQMDNITITKIQTKILNINNKLEIVEKVVNNKYKKINVLKEQINELNNYIKENNDKLSSDTEVEAQILSSLDSVE